MPSVSTGRPKALRPTAPYFEVQTRPGLPPGPVAEKANCRVVGYLLAGDHPEERRLARAVRADQADFFAGIELKRGVDEQDLTAVLLLDAGEGDHSYWSPVDCT